MNTVKTREDIYSLHTWGPGIVAGACGNPAVLAYANKLAPTDRPDIGYAMIFPGMTIVRILFVDIAPVFFRG